MRTKYIFLSILAIFCIASTQTFSQRDSIAHASIKQRNAILNALRDEIDKTYGIRQGIPRINLGPCGPFAKAFYDEWNAHFSSKVIIAFIMREHTDQPNCPHIVVKLPDGNYYDGGMGVMTDSVLLSQFPNCRIEDMNVFEMNLLERNAYGLSRKYKMCPNYSNAWTIATIKKYLNLLAKKGEG